MTRNRLPTAVLAASLIACFATDARADDSWQVLMRFAPPDANVLVMINAEKVRGSRFAQTTGWNSADTAPGGLRSILPRGEIRRVLFAARLNLINLASRWEAGILETKSDPSLEVFAAGVHVPHELLGTTTGIRLPSDAYFLKLAPSLFGILGPADRQVAARWAGSTTSSKPLDSHYLTKIASFPETVGTEVMLGIDLVDAVDAAVVKQVMQQSPVIRESKIDPEAAADIIHSIEGMALGVRVLEQATGMIRVDFMDDPSLLTPVMKPLLLERLAARGAMIEDFKTWKMEVKENTAFLGGALSPVGLSLILSLVEPELPADQPTARSGDKPADQTKSTPTDESPRPVKPSVEKSREHFTKVRQLVYEVRFPASDLKFVSAGAFGGWIDRQARRIDMMPMLGVDPDLLDFSQGVAKSLRITAAKQRGATINASAYSSRSYRYSDGYQLYMTESPNQIQGRMENASANLSHVDVMRMIDDETADIRRKMTERYQVEF